MTELLVAIIGAFGSICAAGVAAYLANAAKKNANQAATNTAAVSNGFAEHTTESLEAIRRDVKMVGELIMHHIEAHADAELRKQ